MEVLKPVASRVDVRCVHGVDRRGSKKVPVSNITIVFAGRDVATAVRGGHYSDDHAVLEFAKFPERFTVVDGSGEYFEFAKTMAKAKPKLA